jgi:hypothetical protein
MKTSLCSISSTSTLSSFSCTSINDLFKIYRYQLNIFLCINNILLHCLLSFSNEISSEYLHTSHLLRLGELANETEPGLIGYFFSVVQIFFIKSVTLLQPIFYCFIIPIYLCFLDIFIMRSKPKLLAVPITK